MSADATTGNATAEAIARSVEHQIAEEYRAAGHSPMSPEARIEQVLRTEAAQREQGVWERAQARISPGTRPFEVMRRVVVGTYVDGFIHAGNLAYLALIALFPFFITATAVLTAFGQSSEGENAIRVVLSAMPPNVAGVLAAPIREAMTARSGPLLWLGGAIGLWTVGSLIETIRDILHRAYGSNYLKTFIHYRLYSIGITFGAVALLMLSFSTQVLVTAIDEFVTRMLPEQYEAIGHIATTRLLSAVGLFVALFLLFITLTPEKFRGRACPKWPGAVVTTAWWIAVTVTLPRLLATVFNYDLTYGSLAGIMITLFFFYLVGLGVVVGAELNAALVDADLAAHDDIGQADNRRRKEQQ